MIRALALCLLALPAQAQDFRGLLPGMPVADLARLGEPFEHQSQDGFTFARYPLPFARTLEVLHTDGEIILLTLSALADPPLQPPATEGLRVGETTLRGALDLIGPRAFDYDVIQTLPQLPPSGWELSYTLVDHADLVLTLTFYGRLRNGADADGINGPQDMPQDATLITATLVNPSVIGRFPMLADLAHTPPDDATPLALSLTEAFPLDDIPQ